MFKNLKFEGISYRPRLMEDKVYFKYDTISYMRYVDGADGEDGYIMVYFKDGCVQRINLDDYFMIDYIEVEGYIGMWYTLDTKVIDHTLYLQLESEVFGDEMPHLIVDHKGNVILDDVWNGFEDLDYYLGDH